MTKIERIQESLLLYLRSLFLLHCTEYNGLFFVPKDIEKKFLLVVSSARSKKRFRLLSQVEFDFCVQTVFSIDVLPLLQKNK